MVFSSLLFVFLFLPGVIVTYYLVPQKFVNTRNMILLAWSMAFYFFGEPRFILFLIGSIVFNYVMGLLMNARNKKILLALAISVNLGLLLYFKYANFFVRNVNSLFGSQLNLSNIIMPIGISFFTFQALSYVIDVYRDLKLKQKNIFKIALYISMFPQLIAGPIVRYEHINEQLNKRQHTWERFSYGICRFIQGLAKKVLLANSFAMIADYSFALQGELLNVSNAWVGAIAYAAQIYFDFSGYSDMAIGLGHFFGFKFRENFNLPYSAISITDFWRRWHISLSTWFRDYVYIPLGGNRKGPWRQIFNLLVVWMLTGFWHGAEWNFLLWGLYYALLLILEKNFLANILQKWPKFARRLYTMFFVTIGWVIFRTENLRHLRDYLSRMFGGSLAADSHLLYFVLQYGIFLAGGILLIIIGKDRFKKTTILTTVAELFLAFLVVLKLLGSSYNPFIYFRF